MWSTGNTKNFCNPRGYNNFEEVKEQRNEHTISHACRRYDPCGKTHYLLKILEEDFKGYFKYAFIVCPTLLENSTYQNWKYLKDPDVFALPCDHDEVDSYLETIVKFAKGTNSLIILDDCASSQTVKNRTNELVKLAFHGRHIGLSTQQLTSIAKPYRMNVSKVVVFYSARKGRPQGHLRKLPLRRKGRGEKNFRDVEEREIRPVGNSNGPSVHAQGRRPLKNFVTDVGLQIFFFQNPLINGTGILIRGLLQGRSA